MKPKISIDALNKLYTKIEQYETLANENYEKIYNIIAEVFCATKTISKESLSGGQINNILDCTEIALSHIKPEDTINIEKIKSVFFAEAPAKLERCVSDVYDGLVKKAEKPVSKEKRKELMSRSYAICNAQLKKAMEGILESLVENMEDSMFDEIVVAVKEKRKKKKPELISYSEASKLFPNFFKDKSVAQDSTMFAIYYAPENDSKDAKWIPKLGVPTTVTQGHSHTIPIETLIDEQGDGKTYPHDEYEHTHDVKNYQIYTVDGHNHQINFHFLAWKNAGKGIIQA